MISEGAVRDESTQAVQVLSSAATAGAGEGWLGLGADRRPTSRAVCVGFVLAGVLSGTPLLHALSPIQAASRQLPAPAEKESRTPAQQKIDSQLLYEIYRLQGTARQKHVPAGQTGVQIDQSGRALVDLRADLTPALEKAVRSSGATIVSTSREYHSIIAWFPLLKLERIARNAAVRSIAPAPEPTTVR